MLLVGSAAQMEEEKGETQKVAQPSAELGHQHPVSDPKCWGRTRRGGEGGAESFLARRGGWVGRCPPLSLGRDITACKTLGACPAAVTVKLSSDTACGETNRRKGVCWEIAHCFRV